METMAVIDFETTGLSPNGGARATEIAVVIVQEAKIVGRYQSLMNADLSPPISRITEPQIRDIGSKPEHQ